MIRDRTHILALMERDRAHQAELRALDGEKLRLQAVEYERRLEGLNGEAGRLAAVLDRSVTAEKFEDYQKSEEAKRLEREKTVDAGQADLRALLSVLTSEVRDAATRRRLLGVLAGAAATVITLTFAAVALLL